MSLGSSAHNNYIRVNMTPQQMANGEYKLADRTTIFNQDIKKLQNAINSQGSDNTQWKFDLISITWVTLATLLGMTKLLTVCISFGRRIFQKRKLIESTIKETVMT